MANGSLSSATTRAAFRAWFFLGESLHRAISLLMLPWILGIPFFYVWFSIVIELCEVQRVFEYLHGFGVSLTLNPLWTEFFVWL